MTLARAAALCAIVALAACSPKAEEAEKAEADAAAAPAPTAAAPVVGAAPVALAPGLWKTQVLAGMTPMNSNRMCYDAALAQKLGVMARAPQAGETCTETMTPNADGSMAFTSTCGARVTTGVMRGDPSKAYSVEFSSGGQAMKIEAVREGDCPADFKPGDMEVQGVKINVLGTMMGPK